MRNIRCYGAMLVTLLAIAGCATSERYEQMLQTWVGKHVDDLVLAWGPPQSSYELSSGLKVLEWERRSTQIHGGHTVPTTTVGTVTGVTADGKPYSGRTVVSGTTTTPAYLVDSNCRTRFKVRPDGIIEGWQWEGNSCRM